MITDCKRLYCGYNLLFFLFLLLLLIINYRGCSFCSNPFRWFGSVFRAVVLKMGRSFSAYLSSRFDAFGAEENHSMRNDAVATIIEAYCFNCNIYFDVGRVKLYSVIFVFASVLRTKEHSIVSIKGSRFILSGRYSCFAPLTVQVFDPSTNRACVALVWF